MPKDSRKRKVEEATTFLAEQGKKARKFQDILNEARKETAFNTLTQLQLRATTEKHTSRVKANMNKGIQYVRAGRRKVRWDTGDDTDGDMEITYGHTNYLFNDGNMQYVPPAETGFASTQEMESSYIANYGPLSTTQKKQISQAEQHGRNTYKAVGSWL